MFEQYGATFILYDLVFLDLFIKCIIFFSVHSISLYIFLSLIMLIILPLTLLLLHEQGLKHLICYISLLFQGCKKQILAKIIISFSFCPRFAKYLNLAKHWQYFFFSFLFPGYKISKQRPQGAEAFGKCQSTTKDIFGNILQLCCCQGVSSLN